MSWSLHLRLYERVSKFQHSMVPECTLKSWKRSPWSQQRALAAWSRQRALAASPVEPPLNSSLVFQEQEEHEAADEIPHDPHFEPIVSLPELEVKTLEEDEVELFKM